MLLPGPASGHRDHAPATGRPDLVDLLLCSHHWRARRDALRAAGATAYDEAGILIMPGGNEVPHASRQPGAQPPQGPARDRGSP